MSLSYTPVQWSRHKRIYDAIVLGSIFLYVAGFVLITLALHPGDRAPSGPIIAMRATGSCAIILLHVILCIGPLARLDSRFLPVLYNRRHLGVMTFCVALFHAIIVVGFYHGFGVLNPLVSLLGVNPNFLSLSAFPFQVLGLGGLVILFLLASTSHDFWLRNLSPNTWKRLHILVYPAYVLLVGHVVLGALQADRGMVAALSLGAGVASVCTLHLFAGLREARTDQGHPRSDDGWLDAGPADSIPESRARTVCAPSGERIAIYRHEGCLSAVTNVCAHQGGPVGEGKIIDGCITCPWHGWQYKPGDGRSPPPFKEKIATFQVRVIKGRVQVHTTPRTPGTPLSPIPVKEPKSE